MLRLFNLLVVISLPAVCSALFAQDQAESKTEISMAREQFNQLSEKFNQAQAEYRELYKAAKTAAERKEALESKPDPAEYAADFLKLAAENKDDDAAVEAIGWILSYAARSDEAQSGIDLIQAAHVKKENMSAVIPLLDRFQEEKINDIFKAVLAENPDKKSKAYAAYALAKRLNEDEATVDEAEKYYQRIVDEFGDVMIGGTVTLADIAEPQLFIIKYLRIGKVAPDIEGEDIDGVAFKLSDYRGKVVVIDFWGDW